jgi:hypothetical protein
MYSYLKQTKTSFFFQKWRTGGQNKSCLGSRKDVQRGYKRVNMVQILCNMYVNGKMRPVETIPEMEEEG